MYVGCGIIFRPAGAPYTKKKREFLTLSFCLRFQQIRIIRCLNPHTLGGFPRHRKAERVKTRDVKIVPALFGALVQAPPISGGLGAGIGGVNIVQRITGIAVSTIQHGLRFLRVQIQSCGLFLSLKTSCSIKPMF